MGLTNSAVGRQAIDSKLVICKKSESDKVIALAGNPNVGKSTVFNGLTGLKQHTGNWPGKTVINAQGYCRSIHHNYVMVDIPGTYSLMAHSAEEEVARNFICFGNPDAVIVVCDATCLERNLNLVLQTIEISKHVIVCVNLLDEAKRKHIEINLTLLSQRLGVPVIGITARKKKTLKKLLHTVDQYFEKDAALQPLNILYDDRIEEAIRILEQQITPYVAHTTIASRWVCLKLLELDSAIAGEIEAYLGLDITRQPEIIDALEQAKDFLIKEGINQSYFEDLVVSAIVKEAEKVCEDAVIYHNKSYDKLDRRIDRIVTSKVIGYPIMLGLLALVFWITIVGANYPSEMLSSMLFQVQGLLTEFFIKIDTPTWLHEMLVLGVYRVLAWVVSVMLPPMAIFFPLFTLLEDSGYLPRIAYNLDKPFKKCCACGKQALTMCMGFGCNAAGVVGCRIIDSPRERLLAILTNNFVPCNGRFPTLIAILSMFFICAEGVFFSSIQCAFFLTILIVMGILITFLVTKVLSKTILKGVPSSFTLELPPYRKPQVIKVLVRSICDRTFFVLSRAICAAIPAGLLIWSMANIEIGEVSILNYCAAFLDPFANLMGLDGVILIAFILGFPANEIVIPIMIMTYLERGSLQEQESLLQLKQVFVHHGWTWVTAMNTMLFSLIHWPCSTTLLTIKKETGSWRWTGLAVLIPTVLGVLICVITTFFARLFY